jgi:galactan 5-O-arabinofuranosyltransferase
MTTETLPSGHETQSPVEAPPVVRLTLRRTLTELLLGVLAAVLGSLVLQAVANRMHVGPGNYVPAALTNLATALILGALLAVLAFSLARRRPLWAKLLAAWAALTALTTVMLAVPLQATRFYLGGSSVDNSFRMQYLERFSASTSLADGNYHGIAPYYPGGWFWLGGRFANLLGMDGWAAYKPYAICWAAITAVVTFVLWSLVLRRRLALLATLATVLAGFLSVAVEEPYAWPSAAWLPPVAVLAWTALSRRDRLPPWVLVLIGCYLGFCGLTYTLHLAFGALLVVAMAAVACVLAVRAGARVSSAVRSVLPPLVVIGAVGAVVTASWWAPFVLAGGLGMPNMAARFLPSDSAYFPLPFGPGSVFGVLCLAGLLWLLLRARRDAVAAALLITAALVYVWFGLSTVALALQTTLLAFRFLVVLDVLLMVGGVLGLVELSHYLWTVGRGRAGAIRIVGFTLAATGALTLSQVSLGSALNGFVATAESDYYPTGYNAKGQHEPGNEGAWSGQLITAIDELSRRDPTANIVLSQSDHLLSFRPYWGFQHTVPHYANPLARYEERSAQIRSFAAATSTADLLTRVGRSPFTPPNVFVLRRDAAGTKLSYSVKSDFFPQPSPVRSTDVSFDAKVFDSPLFARRDVGPYTVVVRR